MIPIINRLFRLTPALTFLSPALMGVGIAVGLITVHSLISQYTPDSGWRSLPLYLVPGLHGGVFRAMPATWRLS